MQPVVLVLGSGPKAAAVRDWDLRPFDHVVAINNAWRIRPDWTASIYPEDFPLAQRPPGLRTRQTLVEASDYVPIQNDYGGVVYAGGTMAFTAGYWALGALRPAVMAFFGCDMVYPATGNTHFYGSGTADPLRPDVTLQSLEAKSARLQLIAAQQGCACVNLSDSESRLLFPRGDLETVSAALPILPGAVGVAAARQREAKLGYMVTSGRYWLEADRFDAPALAALDALWLAAHDASLKTAPVPETASQPRPRDAAFSGFRHEA